jgi:cation diffusion facilitator CzcD-associated flavoprotein CzcO
MPEPYDVAVIGAGFGGLGMAIQLERSGTSSYVVLEKAAGIGGTWRDNTYPGAGCDVPSHLYSFSFHPGSWTRYGLATRLRFGAVELAHGGDDRSSGD